MNRKTLIAIATVATAFSGLASAGEADLVLGGASSVAGQRPRAEVQSEAVQAAQTPRLGEADASAAAKAGTLRDAQAVKAEAVQASRFVRLGEAS